MYVTYVSPKWRRKQLILVDGGCHLAHDFNQVARPAAEDRRPNTLSSKGVICIETKQVNTQAYIEADAPEPSRPTGPSRSCTNVDLLKYTCKSYQYGRIWAPASPACGRMPYCPMLRSDHKTWRCYVYIIKFITFYTFMRHATRTKWDKENVY